MMPADFKNITGVSRKYMIPLLEYFDEMKLTIRSGDKRLLRPPECRVKFRAYLRCPSPSRHSTYF